MRNVIQEFGGDGSQSILVLVEELAQNFGLFLGGSRFRKFEVEGRNCGLEGATGEVCYFFDEMGEVLGGLLKAAKKLGGVAPIVQHDSV